jgi:hypothetical protein
MLKTITRILEKPVRFNLLEILIGGMIIAAMTAFAVGSLYAEAARQTARANGCI